MDSGRLLPTANLIDSDDVELFFVGVGAGLITLKRGARFNTLDRPTASRFSSSASISGDH
jgi:hypothetical protein